MTNLNVSSNQIQLGLCDPPEPIYIYVGQTENNGQTSLWYRYDIDAQKQHPVLQRALTGYLSELRITIKEYKGKENHKIDLVFHADQVYIIRSGLETNFSKTLLLALSTVTDINQPLTIAVVAGEENVVFARLYNAITKVRFLAEWKADANWLDLVSKIQQRLGQSTPVEELRLAPPIEPEARNAVCDQINPQTSPQPALVAPGLSNSEAKRVSYADRVKAVRTLTGHSVDAVKAILAHYETDHPKKLTPEQCDEVIEILVSYWYQILNKSEPFPSSDWWSIIQQLQQQGLSEAEAIKSWMTQIKQQPSQFKVQN